MKKFRYIKHVLNGIFCRKSIHNKGLLTRSAYADLFMHKFRQFLCAKLEFPIRICRTTSFFPEDFFIYQNFDDGGLVNKQKARKHCCSFQHTLSHLFSFLLFLFFSCILVYVLFCKLSSIVLYWAYKFWGFRDY